MSCDKNDQHLQGDGAGEGEGVRKPGEGRTLREGERRGDRYWCEGQRPEI